MHQVGWQIVFFASKLRWGHVNSHDVPSISGGACHVHVWGCSRVLGSPSSAIGKRRGNRNDATAHVHMHVIIVVVRWHHDVTTSADVSVDIFVSIVLSLQSASPPAMLIT